MSRIRSIHPGLFTDESYMALSLAARELIKGLWVEADDQGVFQWKPLTLKARIFPADNIDVKAVLTELAGLNFVRQYEHDGQQLGAIRNFRKFQRPKFPNATHFIPDDLRSYVGLTPVITEMERVEPPDIPHVADTPPPKSPQMERRMEDGEKKEGKSLSGKPRAARSRSLTETPEFLEFYEAYPKKVKKPEALKAFFPAVEKVGFPRILEGARRYAEERRGQEKRYTLNPATWLNQECWNDEPRVDEPARNGRSNQAGGIFDAIAQRTGGAPPGHWAEDSRPSPFNGNPGGLARLPVGNGASAPGGSGSAASAVVVALPRPEPEP